MHREGDTVIYDEREQRLFGVPAQDTAVGAVTTALAFHAAAMRIQSRNNDLRNYPGNAQRGISAKLEFRAGRLAAFSCSVFQLCPEEHLRVMIDEASASPL